MSQSRPRTLIIGLGSIGQRHADLQIGRAHV